MKGAMFEGMVVVVSPVGLTQKRVDIFSKRLVENGASIKAMPAKLTQKIPAMFLKGKDKKRQREEGTVGHALEGVTHAFCEPKDFNLSKLLKDLGIPLPSASAPEEEQARHVRGVLGEVKLVSTQWLSDCLLQKKRLPLEGLEGCGGKGDDGGAKEQGGGPSYLLSAAWSCAPPKNKKQKISPSPASAAAGAGEGATEKKSGGRDGRVADAEGHGAGGGLGLFLRNSSSGGRGAEIVFQDVESNGGWDQPVGDRGYVHRFLSVSRRFSSAVAAFDMDCTVIRTKSGAKFPRDKYDWKLFDPSVPAKLKTLYDKGYRIVLVSNQGGIGKGKLQAKEIQDKVEDVIARIGIPMEAYLCCGDDLYRKPRPGIWDLLKLEAPLLRQGEGQRQGEGNEVGGGAKEEAEEEGGEGKDAAVSPTVAATAAGGAATLLLPEPPSASLFVGDAAGRPKRGSTWKKDFSAGDLKLALNLGMQFQTPEQFFLDSSAPLHCSRADALLGFNPATLRNAAREEDAASSSSPAGSAPGVDDAQEVLVLVGSPAAGKSSLCASRFPRHTRVNQDTLKTRERCMKAASAALGKGESVVIDSTNRDKVTRAHWVQLAQEKGVPARCVHLTTSLEAAKHFNTFRRLGGGGEEDKRGVPDVVLCSYFKHREAPSTEEGFERVEQLEVVPGANGHAFLDAEKERLFYMYLR